MTETREMLRFLTHKLKSSSLNEVQPLPGQVLLFSYYFLLIVGGGGGGGQACHFSGFRPEIIGFFIALPALRL